MQVRWVTTVRSVSFFILTTRLWVFSRVDPPAPYVTLTHEGFSGMRSEIVRKSLSHPPGVLGGKNSKLKLVFFSLRISRTNMVLVKNYTLSYQHMHEGF